MELIKEHFHKLFAVYSNLYSGISIVNKGLIILSITNANFSSQNQIKLT